MRNSQLFSIVGFLLGWGAPLGALALRFVLLRPLVSLVDFVQAEWAQYPFFYWYMLLATALVLSIVGYLLGQGKDLEDARNQEKVGS